MEVELEVAKLNYSVNMKNELIRAAHGLTLMEKRLLMLSVSKLDSKKPALPQNMIVRIQVSDFIDQYGIAAKSTYGDVKAASEHLMDRYIRFFSEDNKTEIRMQWVGRTTYKESEGTVELAFWHELSPMLFELEQQFTSYKLSRAGALRSIYSWRLFELLMQFKSTGFLVMPVDEFSRVIEAPKTYQRDFSLLRTKCIEPAVKEIQEKDGLKISWEPIKAGRKVKTLKFTFPVEQKTVIPRAKSAKSAKPVQRTPEQLAAAERASELAHYKKLAELSGEPLETLLPRHLKEKASA